MLAYLLLSDSEESKGSEVIALTFVIFRRYDGRLSAGQPTVKGWAYAEACGAEAHDAETRDVETRRIASRDHSEHKARAFAHNQPPYFRSLSSDHSSLSVCVYGYWHKIIRVTGRWERLLLT